MYALLKLHGARVTLTMISPNHLLRGNTPVTATFVHDRNEVFNDRQWNRRIHPTTWPKGGQKYLGQRVKIARRALQDAPADKQVFLSFHADNDPPSGQVVTLLYYKNGRTTDHKSRQLAERLLPDMGAGAQARGRNLGVLRNNPTTYKLLVEMRNLAFEDHIWAVRYEELRKRDAEKVVQALPARPGAELGLRPRGIHGMFFFIFGLGPHQEQTGHGEHRTCPRCKQPHALGAGAPQTAFHPLLHPDHQLERAGTGAVHHLRRETLNV